MKINLKTILLLGALIMAHATYANNNFNKPLFVLGFSSLSTDIEIRLNDIPIQKLDAKDGKTTSEKPIPEFIIDGNNKLKLIYKKQFSDDADTDSSELNRYVEAFIAVREENSALSNNQKLVSIKLQIENNQPTLTSELSNTINIIEDNEESIIVEADFTIDSPFPIWQWQNGEVIDNNKDNYNSLFKTYEDIYAALKNKDINQLYNLYGSAAEEFQKAYHLSSIQSSHELMSTGEYMNDDDWVLGDMEKFRNSFEYHIEVFGNGRLARIMDHKNRPPIVYLNKKAKVIINLKFMFYMKNEQWIMIR